MCPALRFDIPLRFPEYNNYRPRTPVRVPALRLSSQDVWHPPLPDNPEHPAANGLVERFHRTMKAAIMCHADKQFSEALPLVLLGIRSVYKEDLKTSVAEHVSGEPLLVPGELLTPTTPTVEPAHFIQQLRRHMRQLRPVLTRCEAHQTQQPFPRSTMVVGLPTAATSSYCQPMADGQPSDGHV
jgi:hypothetical protein